MSSFVRVYTLFIFIILIYGHQFQLDKIKRSDIEKLNFNKGSYTNSRRFKSSPKLECFSTAVLCSEFEANHVECSNRDNKWECKATFAYGIRFGYYQVMCEGYESDLDEFVLVGSCKLKYTLERVQTKSLGSGVNIEDHSGSSAISIPTIIGVVISLFSIVFIIVGKILCCKSSETTEAKISYTPQKNEPDLTPPAIVQLPLQPESLPVGNIENLNTGLVSLKVVDLNKNQSSATTSTPDQNTQAPQGPPPPLPKSHDSVNDLYQTVDPSKKIGPRAPPPVPDKNLLQRKPPPPPVISAVENVSIKNEEVERNGVQTLMNIDNQENPNNAILDPQNNFDNLGNLSLSIVQIDETNLQISETNNNNEFSIINNLINDAPVLQASQPQNNAYVGDFFNNLLSNTTAVNVDSLDSFQVLPSISDAAGNFDLNNLSGGYNLPVIETQFMNQIDSKTLEEDVYKADFSENNTNLTDFLPPLDSLQQSQNDFDFGSLSIYPTNPPTIENITENTINNFDLTGSLLNQTNSMNEIQFNFGDISMNPVEQKAPESQLNSSDDFFSNLLSNTMQNNANISNSFPLPLSIPIPNNGGEFNLKDIQGDYIEVSMNNNQQENNKASDFIANNDSLNFSSYDFGSSIIQNTESQPTGTTLGGDFLADFLTPPMTNTNQANEINNGFNNDLLFSFLETPAASNSSTNGADFSLLD